MAARLYTMGGRYCIHAGCPIEWKMILIVDRGRILLLPMPATAR